MNRWLCISIALFRRGLKKVVFCSGGHDNPVIGSIFISASLQTEHLKIKETGRAPGFSRLNSPAIMGNFYETLNGVNLDNAAIEATKKPAEQNHRRSFTSAAMTDPKIFVEMKRHA